MNQSQFISQFICIDNAGFGVERYGLKTFTEQESIG